ncbi:MAG: branched-chain amino acid transporter, periplasmic binding protein [Subtercola sp.]|nr:branched-chain amino acid transporter, periplasmic binding protein [Subtercola sp.]
MISTRKKTIGALGSGIALALALSACSGSTGGDASSSGAANTLQIGMIDSLTGSGATGGTSNQCSALIAEQAINAGDTAATSGWKVDLTIVDDQTNPAISASQATNLTSAGTQLFVGGTLSSTILAAMPIIDAAGGLHTGGTSKSVDFLKSGTNVVRLNDSNTQSAVASADQLKQLGIKSVVIVADKGAYGEGGATALTQNLGGDVQATTVVVDPTQNNFDPVITQISSAKPDAVVAVLAGGAHLDSFFKSVHDSGLDVKSIGFASTITGATLAPSNGAIDGVITTSIYDPSFDNPANDAYKAAFAKYAPTINECSGKSPEFQGALTWSQILLLAQAAAKTGSSDPSTLRQAIVAGSWNLPQGAVTFGSDGQANGTYQALIGAEIDGKPSLAPYTGN